MPNNEWGTPSKYARSVRNVLGRIDLDPASNELANETVQAREYLDVDRNGLNQSWYGTVYLNPPYGRGEAKPFAEKLVKEFRGNRTIEAICLTNNVTDTDWFADSIGRYASAFCFPDHRIQFIAPEGAKKSSNSHGQVFSYFGKDIPAFMVEFQQYGLCVIPWRR